MAGAPPDAYATTGQLWGNPLYDWPALQRRHYRWWVQRLRRTLELFDLVRIDHFRGLVAYWAVPETDRTAAGGRWRRGPGAALFRALDRELGRLPLVAEDLGVITPAVERLRDNLGLPGMIVVQFGFDPDRPPQPPPAPQPPARTGSSTRAPTTTTPRGAGMSRSTRQCAPRSTPPWTRRGWRDGDEPWWGLVRYAFSSRARVAMIQAQDVLGLGSEARMNVPGTAAASWRWQMARGRADARRWPRGCARPPRRRGGWSRTEGAGWRVAGRGAWAGWLRGARVEPRQPAPGPKPCRPGDVWVQVPP